MSRKKLREGFTIIEVLLVLAIAGLIFLMTFIALPALQRQSKDTQRREDMAQLISAIKKYQQNNRGVLPSDWTSFRNKYLKEDFTEPNGSAYTISASACGSMEVDLECTDSSPVRTGAFSGDGVIHVISEAKCDGEKAVKSANPRKAAILYRLESGGTFCEST